MARDPLKYFRIEVRDLLDQLGRGVLALEKAGAGQGQIQHLLRLAHTLKGAARVVKQVEIADLAHAAEDQLSAFREAGEADSRERFNVLLKLLDQIHARVQALAPAPAPDEAGAGGPPLHHEAFKSIRTDMSEVDALLEGIAETHTALGGLRRSSLSLDRAQRLADLLTEQLAVRGARESLRAGLPGADKSHAMAEELRSLLGHLDRQVVLSVEQMDRELRQVREAAEQLRLMPAQALFTTLERTVRDTAHALGKQVRFEGRGAEVRLDAQVLGVVQGALLQITRNAVAHGIESETERLAAGKPPVGHVLLEVVRRGRQVVFVAQDDGRGIDLEAIHRMAIQKGLSPAQAGKLGASDLMRLLLRGGISTSATVTAVAGRGIGMDIVRETVERLGGDVTVQTSSGGGTRFELVVPLSLASLEALVVQSAGVTVSIPLEAVREAMLVPASELAKTSMGDSVVYAGKAIPFVPLSQVLRLGAPAHLGDQTWPAVVVEGAGGAFAALGVERLLGAFNVVIRPLPGLTPADPVVSGASVDADGNPQLVLDPEGLVTEAAREGHHQKPAAQALAHVLVIDDSLTTRMLEQSILESAGYVVDTASSAEEALEMARTRKYALFLVDVEMPGMDGFTFIERTRQDQELRSVPAILVTSRSSQEDLLRGQSVGASGYMIKSEFDQVALLASIRRLVG